MPIVLIEWEDSMGSPGWHNQERWSAFVADPQPTCRTAGFLAKRERRGLWISQSQNDNGQLGDLLFIPRSAVRRVEIIAKLARAPKDGRT